jgi:drug/metabolite transporter (DMT)-like permease
MLDLRCFVQKVCMIPVLCWTKAGILGPPGDVKARLRMGAQAVISGCILLSYFEGIRRLPIGDFGAIAFSSPAFTIVLSIFMLKDHCGVYRCIIGIVLTVGVVLISRPTAMFPEESVPEDNATTGENVATTPETPQLELKTSVDLLGIFFALAGSALSALVTIIAR